MNFRAIGFLETPFWGMNSGVNLGALRSQPRNPRHSRETDGSWPSNNDFCVGNWWFNHIKSCKVHRSPSLSPFSNEMMLSEQNIDESDQLISSPFEWLGLGGKRLLCLAGTVLPAELLFNHRWVPPWVLGLKSLKIGNIRELAVLPNQCFLLLPFRSLIWFWLWGSM